MYQINSVEKTQRSAELISELVELWQASVEASHDFLSPEDIYKLKPFVVEALAEIPELICLTYQQRKLGFLGLADGKIEMLFVSPKFFRQGLGQRLVSFALANYDIQYVDVNEQNPKALAFYEKMGFQVFARSEFDEQGNPFPILHLKLAS